MTWLILAYLASVLLQDFDVGRFRPAEALVDLALTIAFFRLALTSSRWWPLLVCGLMVLTLVAHGVALMEPGLNLRSSVATRWVLGILTVYVLLAGVGERWLAGEAPVSAGARWRRGVHRVS